MTKRSLAAGLATAALAASAAFAAKGEIPITLRDSMGVDWSGELVHYDLTFKPGEFPAPAQAKVVGPNGEVPCQIEDVTYDRTTASILSARIWLMPDVPANTEVTYRVQLGAAPGKQAGGPTLTVGKDAAVMALRVGKGEIAARIPWGNEAYEWPRPALEQRGPILGLKLPSGKWTGSSRLDVPFAVRAFSAEITAQGPLFVETLLRYTFNEGYWEVRLRMVRDSPALIFDEHLDTGFNDKEEWHNLTRAWTLSLDGDGFQPDSVFYVGRNTRKDLGDLSQGVVQPIVEEVGIRGNWCMSGVHGFRIATADAGDLFYLTGYPSVIERIGCAVRVLKTGGDAIGLVGLTTSAWRNPMSLRLRKDANGHLAVAAPLQVYKQHWSADGFGAGSPNYTGETLGVPATTAWRRWAIMLSSAEDEKESLLASLLGLGAHFSSLTLDEVKDWELEWPDPMAKAKWATASSLATTNVLNILRTRVRMRRQLGNYVEFSMAYHFGFAKNWYGTIAKVQDDASAMTAADRAELRRLMAFKAYDLNSVETFPWGTGFHLNNPNMTLMCLNARTKAIAMVPDHPMVPAWGQWCFNTLRLYNARFTRDSGALYENPHYSLGVTLSDEANVCEALMKHGIEDALDTDLFRRSLEFCMNWLTPPDPRFNGYRVVIPIGNCSYQSVPPKFAQPMTTYLKDRHPKLAGQIQWFANQTLPADKKIKIAAEDITYALKSRHFENYGVYFRHGVGTPYETMLHFFAGDCDGHCEWEQDQMTYTLYAKGQPINLHFGNGYFPMICRPWVRNRVSIDHMYEPSERSQTGVEAVAFQPQAEYARAARTVHQIRPMQDEYPLLDKNRRWTPEESERNWRPKPEDTQTIPPTTWIRQILFLKDPDPAGPNYFVIGDGFSGTCTRPTDLSFWFLANTMERTDDTFHFDGQCDVDMDVFVVSPAEPEVETGTYGHQQQPYGRLTGIDTNYFPGGKQWEEQLFLRLRQPAGDDYLTVLYSRLKDKDGPASFTRLAKRAVRVQTPVSTDTILMGPYPFTYKGEGLSFSGVAAAIREFKDGRWVVVNQEGALDLTVAGQTIRGAGPFEVTLKNGKPVGALPKGVTVAAATVP